MKKYKCTNMECNYSCELRTDVFPHKCVNWDYIPTWVEMDGTEPVTESNQLPKLTAEVFDREDCPAWAKWAAVDKGGDAWFYEQKPETSYRHSWWARECAYAPIGGDEKFDASDWQNSAIERLAKLPEWCKVGEWVAYYGENGHKYFKIAKIELNRLYSEDGKFSLMCNVAQARLRPYNAEEMRGLIGKVIVEKKSGDIGLVTGYCNRKESVYAGRNDFVADLLLSDYTLDGNPCGKLEHLEKGEWVE